MTKEIIAQCSIKDCGADFYGRGFCAKHYIRWYRYGDANIVLVGKHDGESDAEHFWRRVKKDANKQGCWEWQGAKTKQGYGMSNICKLPTRFTHRIAWFLVYGKLPVLQVLHKCDNPPCCNPEHLYEGTNDDNVRDRVNRGRQTKGECHYQAKLNDTKVRQIRNLLKAGQSCYKIAKMFQVDIHIITRIKKGEAWKHVL